MVGEETAVVWRKVCHGVGGNLRPLDSWVWMLMAPMRILVAPRLSSFSFPASSASQSGSMLFTS